jgi:serine/threonine-protein kinase RsbT
MCLKGYAFHALGERFVVMTKQATNVTIRGDVDIVAARTKARDIARKVGFGPVDQARIATAISELARNIVQYAGTGSISTAIVENGSHKGIECCIEDKGPGIEHVELAMKDGYTTSGGMGMGLSGASRLMDEFHIESQVGQGTKIVCRKWSITK